MNLRKPSLPPGWYPRQAEEIKRFLGSFDRPAANSSGSPADSLSGALAAVAPHAGWYYSGAVAARAAASLDPGAETVVVAGGHLPAGYPVLAAFEDAAATPLGNIEIDAEFRNIIQKELQCAPDQYRDNTVEVQLPIIKYFFPEARLIWLRLPAENSSFETGKIIARTAARLGRKTVLLGSTDLTHYGDNYGYSPQGRGRKALDWVRNVNDAEFITAVLDGKPEEALRHAETSLSACSAGAVLACLGFASETRTASAKLIAYATSADVCLAGGEDIPDSFVGYAAIGWR
ncbi:MAG: AmmeMemoRadiSam system protein B [Treponema sp.]|jgi:AmmeMemoRadiSam system protein B|nr:AmmeMemoRadiSam system protein B [Treponema sp.]